MSQFGHIDLRVTDIAAALSFYDELLPALGFSERYHGEAWKVWATTEPLPATAYFAITEERHHLANSNRIAFWVGSAAEVDHVTEIARARVRRIVLRRPVREPARGVRPPRVAPLFRRGSRALAR